MSEQLTAHTWFPAVVGRPEWTVRVVDPDTHAADAAESRQAAPARESETSLAALDDTALVAASLEGRRDAFDVIVERHRRAIYQVCFRFVNNHEDASDLAQEAFVRAWRALGTFKGQSALSTWLYRIAVNVSLNHVSARKPQLEPLVDRFVDPRAELPGAALEREERAQAVRDAIASLPEKQRATLILRAYHELPHQQIAEILGSSVGAVKANFFHALANLKKRLRSEP